MEGINYSNIVDCCLVYSCPKCPCKSLCTRFNHTYGWYPIEYADLLQNSKKLTRKGMNRLVESLVKQMEE